MSGKFGSKLIKESTLTVRFNNDGVLLSDMSLAGIVLCCIDGADCTRAIPDERNPSRFLFDVRGNPTEIKEFIEAWFGGKKKIVQEDLEKRSEELRKYTTKISTLKMLMDKGRVNIVDERTKETDNKEV